MTSHPIGMRATPSKRVLSVSGCGQKGAKARESTLYAYACLCFYVHVYACVCLYVHVYACVCLYVHVYACVCFYVHALYV